MRRRPCRESRAPRKRDCRATTSGSGSACSCRRGHRALRSSGCTARWSNRSQSRTCATRSRCREWMRRPRRRLRRSRPRSRGRPAIGRSWCATPARRWIDLPPVTQWLLVANVAIYLLEGTGMLPAEAFALWPPGGFESRFEPWQLVTYSFLHANTAHIFFNMLALYMFGGEIERLFGSRFYTQYYFAAVISAALCHLVVTALLGAPQVPMVGASGGIYGLLLAYGIYFPHRRVILLFPPIPMPARVFVFGFAALELFLGITQTAAGVAHFAHVGGMIGGWLMIQYRRRG